MEAGFYGDTDRVIGFFYEVKQWRLRLVPGWVTTMLDFVEDTVSSYTVISLTRCSSIQKWIKYMCAVTFILIISEDLYSDMQHIEDCPLNYYLAEIKTIQDLAGQFGHAHKFI